MTAFRAALVALLLAALTLVAAPPARAVDHTVTVHATGHGGVPLAGMSVELHYGGASANPPAAGAYALQATATTDAEGRVVFTDRPEGYYKVRYAGDATHPPRWWDGRADLASADWFGVSATTPHPIITLSSGLGGYGSVSATVDDGHGNGLPAACYLALGSQSHYFDFLYGRSLSVGTLAPGTYAGTIECPDDVSKAVGFTIANGPADDPSVELGAVTVPLTYVNNAPPFINGPLEVGRSATVAVNDWSPFPRSGAFRYQWFVGGAPVSTGGTGSSLFLTQEHAGKVVTVRVTVGDTVVWATGAGTVTGGTTPPDPVAPGAPTGVLASAGDGTATLTWGAPVSDGGSPVTGYLVSWTAGGVPQPPVVLGASARSRVFPGLANGTSYSFTVAATNAAGTGPGASAGASPQGRTVTTLLSAPSVAVHGTTVAVRGIVRDAAGAPLGGRSVQLHYRRVGTTAWLNANSATTAADGSVRVTTPLGVGTVAVRLVASGDLALLGSTSSARTIAVARSVTLSASSTARVGRSMAFSGLVRPVVTGRTVYLQQRTGSGWTTVANARTSSTGAYRIVLVQRSVATRDYRVLTRADSRWTRDGVSPTRRVRVTR